VPTFLYLQPAVIVTLSQGEGFAVSSVKAALVAVFVASSSEVPQIGAPEVESIHDT